MGYKFGYITRITPAISVVFIATLLVYSFVVQPYGKGEPGRHHGKATPWQIMLSAYTVILHIMSVMFPARVCWALGDVMEHIKKHAAIQDRPKRRMTQTARSEKGMVTYPMPLFVIILPAYKEEMSTLEETLRVLGSHPQARHSYHVRVFLSLSVKAHLSAR